MSSTNIEFGAGHRDPRFCSGAEGHDLARKNMEPCTVDEPCYPCELLQRWSGMDLDHQTVMRFRELYCTPHGAESVGDFIKAVLVFGLKAMEQHVQALNEMHGCVPANWYLQLVPLSPAQMREREVIQTFCELRRKGHPEAARALIDAELNAKVHT